MPPHLTLLVPRLLQQKLAPGLKEGRLLITVQLLKEGAQVVTVWLSRMGQQRMGVLSTQTAMAVLSVARGMVAVLASAHG